MSGGAAQAWFIAGASVAMLAGGLHVLLTLVDVVRPTYFAPRDAALTSALEDTRMRFGGKAAPSMWNAWLGFNLSHGLGVFTVGLLGLLIATYDFDLVTRIDAIRPVTIAFAAVYFVISLRFWFWAPALLTATATACFTVATVLST